MLDSKVVPFNKVTLLYLFCYICSETLSFGIGCCCSSCVIHASAPHSHPKQLISWDNAIYGQGHLLFLMGKFTASYQFSLSGVLKYFWGCILATTQSLLSPEPSSWSNQAALTSHLCICTRGALGSFSPPLSVDSIIKRVKCRKTS